MRALLFALLFAAAGALEAQPRSTVLQVPTDPTGLACTPGVSPALILATNGAVYFCDVNQTPDSYVPGATGGGSSPGNPGATIGLTPVNGVAATFLRSDGAPALSQSITPVWTGQHQFATTTTVFGTGSSGDVILSFSEGPGTDPRIAWDDTPDNRFEFDFNSTITGGVSPDDVTVSATGLHLVDREGIVTTALTTFPGGQSGGSCAQTGKLRHYIYQPTDPTNFTGSCAGNDTEFIWCGPFYNSTDCGSVSNENPLDYSFGMQFTGGWTETTGQRDGEWFINHRTIGGTFWHPFVLNLLAAQSESPVMTFEFWDSPTTRAFSCSTTSCTVQGAPLARGDLEVVGGGLNGRLYLGGSSGGELSFEGDSSPDSDATILKARPSTTDRSIFLADKPGDLRPSEALEVFLDTSTFTDSSASQNRTFLEYKPVLATTNTGAATSIYSGANLGFVFSSTTTDAQAGTLYGAIAGPAFSGSTNGRDLTGLVGFSARPSFTQSGTGATMGEVTGVEVAPTVTGAGTGNAYYGVKINGVTASGGWAPYISAGIYIANQGGIGSAVDGYDGAIVVEPQGGASAVVGNIYMRGDDHQDGHIVLGANAATGGHLWQNGTSGLRVSSGTPSSVTAGNSLLRHCAAPSIDFASVGATSSLTATGTVTGAAADMACACSPRAAFNDDLIFAGCRGSASNTVELRVYNPTGAGIDPGAVTVDVCCFPS